MGGRLRDAPPENQENPHLNAPVYLYYSIDSGRCIFHVGTFPAEKPHE